MAALWKCSWITLPSSVSRLVMVFCLNLSVAAAWKNFVFSSPNFVHLTVYLFFQYSCLNFKSFKICFLRIFLKLLSWIYNVLCSSSLSRMPRTSLQLATRLLIFEILLLHFFSTFLSNLNLAAILVSCYTIGCASWLSFTLVWQAQPTNKSVTFMPSVLLLVKLQ